MVARLGKRGAVFEASDGYDGAASNIEFVSAFGVGIDGDLGRGGADSVDDTTRDVEIAVGVEAIVGCGVTTDEATGDSEVGGGIDSIVGGGVGVDNTVGYGDRAFGFDGFVCGTRDVDRGAREGDVAIELDAFGGNVARCVVGAGGFDRNRATREECGSVARDAFAPRSGVGDGERAA